MSSTPLVCNVAGPVVFPSQKVSQFQPIPQASDLPSALRALQVINNNFQTLVRLNSYLYNTSDPDHPSNLGLQAVKVGNFTEKSRTKQTKRVFNPNDSEQWVDVEEITSLTLSDGQGHSWTWKQ